MTTFTGTTVPDLQTQVANALFNKGAVLDRLGRDEDARRSWQRVVVSFGHITSASALANMNLAPLAVLDGDVESALVHLRAAQAAGVAAAEPAARSLSRTHTERQAAVKALHMIADTDTDAVNFLALAAWADGRRAEAVAFARSAVARGDRVAPLILERLLDRG